MNDYFCSARRRMETTSEPPTAVEATVMPTNSKPASPASFSSFSMVEVREVAGCLKIINSQPLLSARTVGSPQKLSNLSARLNPHGVT